VVTLAGTQQDAYRAMTAGCALVDRSERGKLALSGAEAKEFLHGQVTNDIEGLEPGRGCYAAFLTHKGKMLGDLRVLDAGDELLLDCERVALQELFSMIRRFKLGRDVELHKRTLESGLLSLIGPQARRVTGAEDLPAEEHAHRAGELAGTCVRLIATDVGVDVLCAAEDTERIAAALAAAGAVVAGEEAAEVLRVESGRPRYGVDLDDGVVREGLLRRAGDRRAAAFPRQAQPPSARPATERSGRSRHAAAQGRARGGAARLGRRLPRARADRAGAGAARGRAGRHARRR
jgi:folate-binding Fe-S cluster repair protein YgfZ